MKYILCFLIATATISCNFFSDKQNDALDDKQREKLLSEKKQRLIANHIKDSSLASNVNWGDIRFTPFVPAYAGLSEQGQRYIENKIQQAIAQVGIGSSVGNPQFVVIPAINILSQNITATAPTMFVTNYSITFYVANMADGATFSSASYQFRGVGQSNLKAFINGFETLKLNNLDFINMLKTGREKALNYYKDNCSKIVLSAKTESSQKNYEGALLILKSIPKDVDCYQQASTLLEKVFKDYQNTNCNKILAQMKAEMGKTTEIDGYSETAMDYYAMIPADAECHKEAEAVYKSYYNKISPLARKNFELKKQQQEQNYELANTKMELEAKVAIDGQTALLKKYEKDHEYEKLPWLRKLVHLGEWDPFDATSKINSSKN